MGGGPDLVQPDPPSTSLRNDVLWRRWTWVPHPISCHQEGGRGQPEEAAAPWGVLKAGRPNYLVLNQDTGWRSRCLRQRVTSWGLMVLSQGFAQPSPRANSPVSNIVKHLVRLSGGRLVRTQFNRAAGKFFFIAFIFTSHNNKKRKSWSPLNWVNAFGILLINISAFLKNETF